jgi:hypothetical protein
MQVGVLLQVQGLELQAWEKLLEGNLDFLQLEQGVVAVWRIQVTLEGGEEVHWMDLLKVEVVKVVEH